MGSLPAVKVIFFFEIRSNPIKVEIWDKDALSDDFMGLIEIPSSKLATNPSFEEWIDVKPRNAKDKVSGQVLVAVKFVEVKYDPEAEKRIKENSKRNAI